MTSTDSHAATDAVHHNTAPFARILVVDDCATNRELVRSLLGTIGYPVVLAENGELAVSLALSSEFAAVLMDCQMPVMDGLLATAHIRRRENPQFRLPIIAVTGRAEPSFRQDCLRAGMDEVLLKPATLDQIASALQHRIDWRRFAEPKPRSRA